MMKTTAQIQKDFIELHQNEEIEKFKISDGKRLTDEQIKRAIIKVLNGEDICNIALKQKKRKKRNLRC